MKIHKFKLKDGEVYIEYGVEKMVDEVKSRDLCSIKSADKPLNTLEKALQNLDQYVIEICELQPEANITVTGVSFSWSENTEGEPNMGAVIVAMQKLKNSTGVVNLVTPHRIENFYADNGDEGQLMPPCMDTDLELLMVEIQNYVNGERLYKQGELFPPGTEIEIIEVKDGKAES